VIGDLSGNPWKVLIVAAVLIVLFGSKKLPDAARSLGRSMRILKSEVSSLHQDESGPAAQAPGNTSGDPNPAGPAHRRFGSVHTGPGGPEDPDWRSAAADP